jgi:hypothetical protein
MTGTIVRVMTFQSGLTEIGMTGWMFSMFCVPFCGPKLRLYCSGTDADQVTDRVLGQLGELLGAHFAEGRAGGTDGRGEHRRPWRFAVHR